MIKSALNEGLEVRNGERAHHNLSFRLNMMHRMRNTYPWVDMQTPYLVTEDGLGQAAADAMAMKTVKSTIVPWPELV